MTYPDHFEMSAEMYPNGGTRLSPAACTFILAELEALVRKYTSELDDPDISDTLRSMVSAHLLGLLAIRDAVKEGMSNK
jgi:hypothetical protein